MKIDCHVHCTHAERNAAGRFCPPLMLAWDAYPDNRQSPENYVAECRRQGIGNVVVLDPAGLAFEARRRFGDFAIPVPMVNPDTVSREEIAAFINAGARGVKFIAPQHSYGDNRYFPLYEVLDAMAKPAFFHCGYVLGDFFDPGGLMERSDYIDIDMMRPAALDRVARAFPNLKMMMAHYGAPWYDEATQIIKCNKNIYADLSGGTAYRRDLEQWRQQLAPNGKLNGAVVEKLCYGTDAQYLVPGGRNGAEGLDEFHAALYECLKLPEDLRQRIDHGNIADLVGT